MRSNCRSLLIAGSLILGSNALILSAGDDLAGIWLSAALAQAKPAAENAGQADNDNDKANCNVGPAAAGGPGGHRHFGGPYGEGGFGHMPLDFSMLNLTEDQKNKIKAIRGRNAARSKELRQQVGTKRSEFRDLMFAADSTKQQLTSKQAEMRALKNESEDLMLSDFLAIKAVLTPEQRKKLSENKPPERRMNFRGPGGGEAPSADGDANSSDKGAGKSK